MGIQKNYYQQSPKSVNCAVLYLTIEFEERKEKEMKNQ